MHQGLHPCPLDQQQPGARCQPTNQLSPHVQPVGPRRTRTGGFTDAAFVFDTKMDEWTYAAPLPAPRFVPSVL